MSGRVRLDPEQLPAAFWSGRHDAYAQRAFQSIESEGTRMRSIEELGAFACREVSAVRPIIARMLLEKRTRTTLDAWPSRPNYRSGDDALDVGATARAALSRPGCVEFITSQSSWRSAGGAA